MNKKLVLALVAVLVIATGAYVLLRDSRAPLGANPGPDSTSECTSQNGLTNCKTRKPLTTATTTPCAIKSPSATSTLVHASLQITTATSTATTWTFASSTTAFATTSLYNTFSLASGALGTMVATTTNITGVVTDDRTVFPPSSYLVWGVAGTVISGTTKLNGFCSASFLVN